ARPERATPARVLPRPAVPRRRVLQPAPLRAPGPSPGRPRRRTERLLHGLPRTAERAARGVPPRLHRAWRVAVAPAVAGRTALPAARRAVPLWARVAPAPGWTQLGAPARLADSPPRRARRAFPAPRVRRLTVPQRFRRQAWMPMAGRGASAPAPARVGVQAPPLDRLRAWGPAPAPAGYPPRVGALFDPEAAALL